MPVATSYHQTSTMNKTNRSRCASENGPGFNSDCSSLPS